MSELKTLLTPAVLKFLPEPLQPADGHSALEEWVIARDSESDVLCVRDISTNRFLGLLILAAFPETDGTLVLRIGYFLVESAWHKGIATELLLGLVHWCKGQQHPMTLLGGVEKANGASGAVLAKAGFAIDPDQSTNETETYQYSL